MRSRGRTGKRAGVSENIGGTATEWAYAYDGLDRLKTATRNGTEDEVFAYDLAGNRVSKTLGASTTTYTYDALDQLETETTGGTATTYDYDGNGNLTAKTSEGQTASYVYDSRNRLRQVSSGPTGQGVLQYEFAYDYSGARFAKAERTGSDDFSRSDFLIDNNNLTGYSQTFLELDHGTGNIDKRFEYGDDLYAQVRWDGATLPPPGEGEGGGEGAVLGEGVTSFFLYDGLGSTRSLTDHDGDIIQSYNYRPFGEGIEHPGELATNHLFTGEYFDNDLDYYYLRARYYSPGMGRFTGYDPVEDANNKLHKYAYCGNDGINRYDPSGYFGIGDYVSTIATLAIVTIVASIAVGSYKGWKGGGGSKNIVLCAATLASLNILSYGLGYFWFGFISAGLAALNAVAWDGEATNPGAILVAWVTEFAVASISQFFGAAVAGVLRSRLGIKGSLLAGEMWWKDKGVSVAIAALTAGLATYLRFYIRHWLLLEDLPSQKEMYGKAILTAEHAAVFGIFSQTFKMKWEEDMRLPEDRISVQTFDAAMGILGKTTKSFFLNTLDILDTGFDYLVE